jgi:hypothetical protein
MLQASGLSGLVSGDLNISAVIRVTALFLVVQLPSRNERHI